MKRLLRNKNINVLLQINIKYIYKEYYSENIGFVTEIVRNYYEENLPVIREKQDRDNREKSFVVNEAREKNYKKRKLENQNPEDRTNCRIKKFPKLYWEGPTFVCVVCNNCLYRNGRSSHQRCSEHLWTTASEMVLKHTQVNMILIPIVLFINLIQKKVGFVIHVINI